MPEECERCRLQLTIEYNRLLAWGDTVGLIHVPNKSHIASSLGTNGIELCGIVSRIGWLLLKFKDISQRWESERQRYRPGFMATTEEDARDKDFTQDISSLSAMYEAHEENRERIKFTSHLTKWMSNAKQVVIRPHRIRWVMVDRGAFDVLLQDLHSLTERLHELSSDHREKHIQEITAKTYREMVIFRNQLSELKAMFDAVTHLLSLSTNAGLTKSMANRDDNHETLRDLLRLKEIKCVSDEILLSIKEKTDVEMDRALEDIVTIRRYDGASFHEHWKAMSMADKSAPAHRKRPRGALSQEGTEYEAWVEWRMAENLVRGSPEEKESKLRTAALGQMLSKDKPRGLSCPTCIGVIDDREVNGRFGWIFQMPEGSEQRTTLKTLNSVLGQSEVKPTLAERISLSVKLASTLLCLHTTDWLHKGIHSDNILFPGGDAGLRIENAFLSGFDYSRPQSNKTTSRSLDPKWDIYRWPGVQNEALKAGGFRKTYDIYSLGLLLLEIGHWKPLNRLMNLKHWPVSSGQDSRIRGWLLQEDVGPPFENGNPLVQLRSVMGDKYWKATSRCLIAHGEGGMRVREERDQTRDPQIDVELHAAFTELVLEELNGVAV